MNTDRLSLQMERLRFCKSANDDLDVLAHVVSECLNQSVHLHCEMPIQDQVILYATLETWPGPADYAGLKHHWQHVAHRFIPLTWQTIARFEYPAAVLNETAVLDAIQLT
ncbi:hypothetical protein FJZ55_10315 [Candidatus Woesearchaeota archaeon]|nr:hypothetical protein [Candidatus Woesearchaeota archaeon]